MNIKFNKTEDYLLVDLGDGRRVFINKIGSHVEIIVGGGKFVPLDKPDHQTGVAIVKWCPEDNPHLVDDPCTDWWAGYEDGFDGWNNVLEGDEDREFFDRGFFAGKWDKAHNIPYRR